MNSKRLENLRKVMLEKNIDAVLVQKRENYIYMSGFRGTHAYLVITKSKAVLITDFRYEEQAIYQAPLYEIVRYDNDVITAINDIVRAENIERIAFEEDYVTYLKYESFIKKIEVKECLALGQEIEKLRVLKDASEISTISKAVEIADNAFAHILNYIKPGVSELDIALELEYNMKKQGAMGASFETIVASGKRSALPHGVASEKIIEYGDTVTLDFGALYKDYCSDMTRTVFVGKQDDEIKKIYNIVLEAQLKAEERAHEGLTGQEIDKYARDIIDGYGYKENFGHGLGHGVGIDIHEEPRVSPKGSVVMKNNMAITIEPGIYVNNVGGVRIEDLVIINDRSPIILTKSTKDIIVL